MSTRRTPLVAVLGAVLTGVLLAGCAVESDGTGAQPSDPTSGGSVTSPPVEPTPNPPSRVPPTSPPAGQMTLTGMVEMLDIEGGCLVLRVGPDTYELTGGDRQVLTPGNRVTVEGRVMQGFASICQVGPIFEVTSARRA